MDRQRPLFDGLPPPAVPPPPSSSSFPVKSAISSSKPQPQTQAPLKPAMKRPSSDNHGEGRKKVQFRTTVEASSEQLCGAMKKIASHIQNRSKFSKASKLALQLLQTGSITPETSEVFLEILRAAMMPPSKSIEPALRADYHELFSAVQEKHDCFSPSHQEQLQVWIIWAVVANDLFTDDSFIFSKAATKVKQAISSLPEDDTEALVLSSSTEVPCGSDSGAALSSPCSVDDLKKNPIEEDAESDPFGLNALLPDVLKREEKQKKKKEAALAAIKPQEEAARLLGERREALMECLRIASSQYKFQWAQTVIDLLASHAFDNINKFIASQRETIERLWASIRDQQMRRRQGKHASGKADLTAFERLQDKYSREKISIRNQVGGGGSRGAEQWLG